MYIILYTHIHYICVFMYYTYVYSPFTTYSAVAYEFILRIEDKNNDNHFSIPNTS